jgi:hypothetical protein
MGHTINIGTLSRMNHQRESGLVRNRAMVFSAGSLALDCRARRGAIVTSAVDALNASIT